MKWSETPSNATEFGKRGNTRPNLKFSDVRPATTHCSEEKVARIMNNREKAPSGGVPVPPNSAEPAQNSSMADRQAIEESPRKRMRVSSPNDKQMLRTKSDPALNGEIKLQSESVDGVSSKIHNGDFPSVKSETTIEAASIKAEEPVEEPELTQEQQERNAGITVFVSSDASGFTGIVKRRYTDFLVNEILPSGEVLHLTDTKIPKKQGSKEATDDEPQPVPAQISAWQSAAERFPKQYRDEPKRSEPQDAGNAPAKPTVVKETFKQTLQGSGNLGGPRKYDKPEYTVHDAQGSKQEASLPAPAQATSEDSLREPQTKGASVIPAANTEINSDKVPAVSVLPPPTNQEAKGDNVPLVTLVESHDTTGIQPIGTLETKDHEDLDVSAKQVKQAAIEKIIPEDISLLESIFGDRTTKAMINLYGNIVAHPERKPRDFNSLTSDTISDRQKRTEGHVAVRRIFSSKLETATIQDSPGTMTIKSAPHQGNSYHQSTRGDSTQNTRKPDKPRQNPRLVWAERGGEHLHFTLYKENKDTMEIMFFIAGQLKMKPAGFNFAGTKDRRGVTVQRVSAHRVQAERLRGLNKSMWSSMVGGFQYHKHGLQLGELAGNEFVITLRDCQFGESEKGLNDAQRLALAEQIMTKAMQSFAQNGFINYYGLQRFGSFSTGTHIVGIKMLQGDLEGAVDAILTFPLAALPENQDPMNPKQMASDDISRADAINTWRKTGHVGKSLDNMPRRFQAETAIIRHLGSKDKKTGQQNQTNDWQGALTQIQRNLRLMYVHAYQSLVWNVMAGKRWELFRNKVVEGDLVIVGEKDEAPAAVEDEVDEDGEVIVRPAADDSAANAEDKFTRARPLSKDEAESGKFDIFDVVLPLPGYDVLYPANVVGNHYKEFMASEAGGKLDPHNMRRNWKDVSLSGGYRKLMARPGKDFSFEVKPYSKDDEQLVETDLERLQNRSRKEQDSSGGDKIAVVIKLQLGTSQYATMALRELTKGGAVSYKADFSGAR